MFRRMQQSIMPHFGRKSEGLANVAVACRRACNGTGSAPRQGRTPNLMLWRHLPAPPSCQPGLPARNEGKALALEARAVLAMLVIGIVAVACVSAQAEPMPMPVPDMLSYQGVLYHADGVTPYVGLQDVEFRLYAIETDPIEEAVWAEKHTDVQVVNGVFGVYLGEGEAIEPEIGAEGEGEPAPHDALAKAFETPPLWLGIKVGLDDEISPRQRISSVPYALTATSVVKATQGGVLPGTIVMYAGDVPPEGWVPCDGTEYSRIGVHRFLFAAIETTWGDGDGGSTFNVPNFQGKTLIASDVGIETSIDANTDGSLAGIVGRSAGDLVGESTVTLSVAELPPHSHSYRDRYGPPRHTPNGSATTANDNTIDIERITFYTGEGVAHSNIQPSAYVNFIIKY